MSRTYYHPGPPPMPGLWPAATFVVTGLQPGAIERSNATYGPGLSTGAIQTTNEGDALVMRGDGVWIPYDPSYFAAVQAYYRYGPGWSFGHHMDAHAAAQDHYVELSAINPADFPPLVKLGVTPRGPRPLDDVSYDRALYLRVEEAHKQAFPPTEPAPPPVPPTPPPPPVEPPVPPIPPTPPRRLPPRPSDRILETAQLSPGWLSKYQVARRARLQEVYVYLDHLDSYLAEAEAEEDR